MKMSSRGNKLVILFKVKIGILKYLIRGMTLECPFETPLMGHMRFHKKRPCFGGKDRIARISGRKKNQRERRMSSGVKRLKLVSKNT